MYMVELLHGIELLQLGVGVMLRVRMSAVEAS